MRPGYVAYAYVRQMRSEVLCQTQCPSRSMYVRYGLTLSDVPLKDTMVKSKEVQDRKMKPSRLCAELKRCLKSKEPSQQATEPDQKKSNVSVCIALYVNCTQKCCNYNFIRQQDTKSILVGGKNPGEATHGHIVPGLRCIAPLVRRRAVASQLVKLPLMKYTQRYILVHVGF